ncbi:MAG TPA: hypothetical protein VES68_03660 [Candidatus Sulfotelmatobacter sp.]|nr:hypothetical protein [Candidatus Sulfotelmatobacter sp.]
MAYKSFNQRFPAFKWVLFLATTFTLILTVFAVQNVSTNYQQHAQVAYPTCSQAGGGCYKYQCPSGGYFPIPGTCAIGDAECCTTLKAPSGLDSAQWWCKYGSPIVEHDSANFWWNSVKYATGYTLYYRIYSNVYNYVYKAVNVGASTNKLMPDIYKNLNGRRIQWYVKAYNSSVTGSASSVVTTPSGFPSCP